MQSRTVYSICIQEIDSTMGNAPSNTTKLTTIRLKNEDIDAIQAMAELIGKDRSETIRILLRPNLEMAKVAMQTKSIGKANKARLMAELENSKLMRTLAKKAEIQTELFDPVDERYVTQAQLA